MNIVSGVIIDALDREAVLGELWYAMLQTLEKPILRASTVIDACDALSKSLGEDHVSTIVSLGLSRRRAVECLRTAREMLSRECLIERMGKELGPPGEDFTRGSSVVSETVLPLGVVLHITSSNEPATALASVIDGLLTGNVNIVKLSSRDDGVSTFLINELFGIEPLLRDYVHVFDCSSRETGLLEKMIGMCDAVVTWGGDEAVQAVRALVPARVKLIEWGHHISFAYVTPGGMTRENLIPLAENVVSTNQLLCSSCTGVYVDTESMEDLYAFCEIFLPLLVDARLKYPLDVPLEIEAELSLKLYTQRIQTVYRSNRIFTQGGSSVTAYEDSALEASIMFGNCWVKRMPSDRAVSALKQYKGHLHTACLLCSDDERRRLMLTLYRSGVTRVTDAHSMSRIYPSAPHDGEFPLRRLVKVASYERMTSPEKTAQA